MKHCEITTTVKVQKEIVAPNSIKQKSILLLVIGGKKALKMCWRVGLLLGVCDLLTVELERGHDFRG